VTTTLTAARVVTPDGVLSPGAVEIDDGVITDVGSTNGAAPDRTLVPGFVDLQVNGVDDVDVRTADGRDWDHIADALARGGTTTWCPTLVTSPLDRYRTPLSRIEQAATRATAPAAGNRHPTIAGVHLEGPFLGVMPGAHPVDLIVPIDAAWLDALPPIVRIVTLGAEVDGATRAIESLHERGIVAGIGHSAATLEEAARAIDAGARLVTHCFNAMPPLHHRAPGLVGAALSDTRVVASVIADLVHVHPVVLTVALRAKGPDGIALVTDAVPRGHTRRPDGTLAGSNITMADGFRNVVEQCGATLTTAARAASTTPARLLGLADRGRLAAGLRADIVALDADLAVAGTWIAGAQVA
jgi:N-acetylglucosamine-6-phosphate deacetylase